MTLHEELIKLAVSFLGVTLLGGAFTAYWTSRQKRREIEEMELQFFYDHYGQLLAAARLWMSVKSMKISLPDEILTRYELLKQASEAESVLEAMLLKLASERFLSKEDQSTLGRFRQGYQAVRESIRDNVQVPWTSSQVDSYLDFKEGASFFASLLRKRLWTLPTSQRRAMQTVLEITHNKHEPHHRKPAVTTR